MTTITTRTLRSGITFVAEVMPGLRSAAIFWLVPGGSAYDPAPLEGRSTIWSELLMRGAGPLDSREMADAVDRLGVGRRIDAGTHHVSFVAELLGERLLDFLPLLVSTVRAPRFAPADVEAARELALQSLESLKDDPQERVGIAARARHLPAPFNRSGRGTEAGLRALTREQLASGWLEVQAPARGIIAVAGAIDPDAIARRFDQLLEGWAGASSEPVAAGTPPRGYAHETDDTNQVQIVLAHDAPPETADDSLLEKIVASVLSGGMASRLFTEVREKRGLCYAVSAGYRGDRDFGISSSYVGTTPERAQESLDVLAAELGRLVQPPPGQPAVLEGEFRRAVTIMKSRLVFAGESTGGRAATLAADMFRLGRARSLAEIAARIDATTLDHVNSYLSRRRFGTVTVQTLGPAPLTPPRLGP